MRLRARIIGSLKLAHDARDTISLLDPVIVFGQSGLMMFGADLFARGALDPLKRLVHSSLQRWQASKQNKPSRTRFD